MLKDMFTLTGRWNRLNRQRFFGYGLLQGVLTTVLFGVIGLLSGTAYDNAGLIYMIYAVMFVVYAGAVWINICLTAKRLHDLDKSAWYFLVYLVPIVGLFFIFYLWFAKGVVGDNQYGPDPLDQA